MIIIKLAEWVGQVRMLAICDKPAKEPSIHQKDPFACTMREKIEGIVVSV